MIKKILGFINNRNGVLSIEFAFCFILFTAISFMIYDFYSLIMLQNKLERATYTVASLFRERSALYPTLDDTAGNITPSLCDISKNQSCFKTKELINQEQLDEAQQLGSYLLNRDVQLRIDTLFILQGSHSWGNINKTKSVNIALSTCDNNSTCDEKVKQYFNQLPDMTSSAANYIQLSPFASRKNFDNTDDLYGRWIPLYRFAMCVSNEQSLYLKLFDRAETVVVPNLCNEITVISRCNDLENPQEQCPLYVHVTPE